MHLFQLPPEVLNMIAHECSSKGRKNQGDWKRMRLVNSILKNFVDPLLYGNFRIFIRSPIYGKAEDKIKALASTTVASDYARDLTIASLSPRYKNDARNFIGAFNHANSEARRLKFNQDIIKAVTSFTNLRSIDWTLRIADYEDVTDAALKHFSRLTSLKTFKLELEGVSLPKSIVYLQELKSLTVVTTLGGKDADIRDFVHRMAAVIGNCPKLEYLELDLNKDDYRKFPVVYLSWLFRRLDASSPLPLKELKLRYIAFDVTEESVIPHLQKLRSLTLLHDGMREELNVLVGNEDSPYIPFVSHKPRWAALADGNIHLEELQVDEMTDGLIAYLSSYSGLQSFKLTNAHTIRMKAIAKWITSFYKRALPKHTETLHTLVIEPEFQTGWCFDSDVPLVFKSILKCKHLHTLGLTWDPESDIELKNLWSLLDLSGEIKNLKEFTIRIPCPTRLRDVSYSVVEDYFHNYNPELMNAVPSYDRADPEKHPKKISVGRMNFGLAQKGEKWVYRVGFSGDNGDKSYWVV